MSRWSAALLAAWLTGAGCAGTTYVSGSGGGLPNPDGTYPGVSIGRDSAGITDPNVRESRRTICRSAGIQREWVAVDYLVDRDCGGSPREPYSAMVVQYLRPLPGGTVLVVCRGQTIPSEWSIDERESDNPGGRCPRNPNESGTGSTVMTISRRR